MKKKLMSSALAMAALAPASLGLPHQGQAPAKRGAQNQPCRKSSRDGLRKAVEKKAKQIVIDELGVDAREVTPTARFIDDLGADSLDAVELVMRFEEEFEIEILDEDAVKIKRMCEAYDYIENHLRQLKQKAR